MDAVISNTTKLLTIGWRGLEPHFLDRWQHRNDLFDIMTVSGDRESSEQTLQNLYSGGLINSEQSTFRRDAFDGGFGNLIAGEGIPRFLADGGYG